MERLYDIILILAGILISSSGWMLFFVRTRFEIRSRFSWKIRFREDGTCHISTYPASPESRLVDAIKYNREDIK